MAERHRVFRRHKTRASSMPTWAGSATTLDRLGALLDELPNVYTGSAPCWPSWVGSRDMPASADRYQDRVLFGKDILQSGPSTTPTSGCSKPTI